jgi:hypothetical protein
MGMQTTLDVLLRKFWKLKIGILAALFTGAETLVSMGYQLPGSMSMPGWVRAVLYMAIISGAFLLRWMAMRTPKGTPDTGDGDQDGK